MRAIGGSLLAILLLAGPAAAYDVDLIQDNGDPANRIDVVILGDGYRDVDQQKLSDDADWFLGSFWQETPYGRYRSYFNVKLVHVVSVDNGADNGTYGADRDTALGAYFGCGGVDRLLCVNGSAVYTVANSHVPEWDVIFVIVNDPKYGGSGGSFAVFSVHPSAGQIAMHEFGHTFAGLADEYEDAYPGYPQCGADCPEPNVTNHSVREEVKWDPWIDPATPVPTPEGAGYSALVGLFEGARYYSTGLYRPKENCKMRALGVPFCDVCAEAIVWNVYAEADPIDSASPASPMSLTSCDAVDLEVFHPVPDPDTMLVTWFVDGQPAQTGGDAFTIEATGLGDGGHSVIARVEDATGLVRRDPGSVLFSEHTWQVNVSGAGQGACLIDSVCYSAGTADPANPCRECAPASDPNAWTPDDTNSCDDGLFCNGAETCRAGACPAGQPACADDGLTCTATCDEATGACNQLEPGWCLIDSACVADGTPDPDNPCQACLPGLATDRWSNDDAGDCSDGLFCDGAETCQAGACASGQAPCSDDQLACTDACDEATDACNRLQPGWCVIAGVCVAEGTIAPDNPCQACLPARAPDGWSSYDAGDCSDGIWCNGQETCRGGACQAGQAPCADDGLDCTTTCDEDAQACGVIHAGSCAVGGVCYASGDPDPDNPCRVCLPGSAADAFSDADGTACDDSDACTSGDVCQAGVCAGERICSAECPCTPDGGDDPGVAGGCGCAVPGPDGPAGLALLGLLGLGLLARRRRIPAGQIGLQLPSVHHTPAGQSSAVSHARATQVPDEHTSQPRQS